MRKSAVCDAALGVAAAVAVSGCSPGSRARRQAAGGRRDPAGHQSSQRYTLYDAPLLTKAFAAAGVKADIQNAQGDTTKYDGIAQTMIPRASRSASSTPIGRRLPASASSRPRNAGIKVIDYDRVNLGGSAEYYVSFDNEEVGKLQAQTLVDCLNAKGVTRPEDHRDGRRHRRRQQRRAVQEGRDRSSTRCTPRASSRSVRAIVKGWNDDTPPPPSAGADRAGGKVDGVSPPTTTSPTRSSGC